MSATQAPRPIGLAVVSYDPMRGDWLVLAYQPAIAGMPVLTVVSAHPERARAEQVAGFHDRPVRAWLVHHPVAGWRRGTGTWVTDPGGAGRYGEDAARQMVAEQPELSLFVLREDGRVTCLDILE